MYFLEIHLRTKHRKKYNMYFFRCFFLKPFEKHILYF